MLMLKAQREWNPSIAITCEYKKLTNLITVGKVQVFLPTLSVVTTQSALTDLQNTIHRSPPSPKKFGAKSQKQPLRWFKQAKNEEQICWWLLESPYSFADGFGLSF